MRATLVNALARALTALAASVIVPGLAGCASANTENVRASAALRGTIGYGSFYSAALAGTDHFAVYLPPGYTTSGLRYPVVYFLHGLPASPDAYRSIAVIARAIEESRNRAIVVGVQGAATATAMPNGETGGRGETGRQRRPSSSFG